MWHQDDSSDESDEDESGSEQRGKAEKPVEKFLIKWNGMSYLHVSWETPADLIELANKAVKMQVWGLHIVEIAGVKTA